MSEPPSSPPSDSASAEDALAWYKSQYEQLEHELVEFRESSRELEQELERDIEQAEKRERAFQEKAESVGFEVEEWKVCSFSPYSQAISSMNGVLTGIATAQVQGVQERGRQRPKHTREGNNDPPGRQPHPATQAARHRGGQRRL